MKLSGCHRPLLLLSLLVSLFAGCASTLSNHNITEISDEAECRGCKDLGQVTGNSHWGGLTGQEISLEVAKKRALQHAAIKGATHVLWLSMTKGFWGASVSGKAYACSETASAGAAHSTGTSKVIPLSKSLAPQKQAPGGSAAVMRLEPAGVDSGVSIVITDVFTNQLQANGKYRIMERSQMSKILVEQGFQNSGACNSAECAVEIGRVLSIDKMFVGSIGRLGESWIINVRIISVQTGEILSTVTKQVVGKVDNLSPAVIQIANELSR